MKNSDQLISISLHGQPVNITIIRVSAPAQVAEEKQTENVCANVKKKIVYTPQLEMMIIIDNWNAENME